MSNSTSAKPLTKRQHEALQKAMEPLRQQAARMSAERDKLREMIEEFTSILETWDEGDEALENGIREIESALDSYSQYI